MNFFVFAAFSRAAEGNDGKYCVAPSNDTQSCGDFASTIVSFQEIENYQFQASEQSEISFLIADSTSETYPNFLLDRLANLKVTFLGYSNQYLRISSTAASLQELSLSNITLVPNAAAIQITASVLKVNNFDIPTSLEQNINFTFTQLETDDKSLRNVIAHTRLSSNKETDLILSNSNIEKFQIRKDFFVIDEQITLTNANWRSYTVQSSVNITLDFNGAESEQLDFLPSFVFTSDSLSLTFTTGWRQRPAATNAQVKGNISMIDPSFEKVIVYSNAGLFPLDTFNVQIGIEFHIVPSESSNHMNIKLVIGLSILAAILVIGGAIIFVYFKIKRPVHVKKAERRESEFGQYIHTD